MTMCQVQTRTLLPVGGPLITTCGEEALFEIEDRGTGGRAVVCGQHLAAFTEPSDADAQWVVLRSLKNPPGGR